ncbi:hypothetical protein [Micromonospora wenchangensis]|uniref:hypothetical protein n=1 Tax=Micromonospora wenchangensis TaxID=1185415 RepID=UPI003802BDF8
MTNLQDVIDAWNDIARAEERYRETLRAAIADGVPQVAISKAIDRTREMLRRDAMTDEQRAAFNRAEAERLRKRRAEKRHN